jgi:hypothetical protein
LTPAIYNLARRRDWPVRELRRDVRTLEMVFNELASASRSTSASQQATEPVTEEREIVGEVS